MKTTEVSKDVFERAQLFVKTFSRIASKWGDLMDVDEDELNYHSKRAIEVPGWIPEFNDEEEEDDVSDECNFDGKPEAQEENNIFEESEEEKVQELYLEVPSGEQGRSQLISTTVFTPKLDQCGGNALVGYRREGGSILNFMEEVVKVGQTMGYNMEGCIKDINDIIESQGEFGETKMGTMDLNTVRSCWGNSIFEYVQSDSVGYSGGILYSCPNISAITLERFISDHRPILLRKHRSTMALFLFDSINTGWKCLTDLIKWSENPGKQAPWQLRIMLLVVLWVTIINFLKDRHKCYGLVFYTLGNSRSDTDILKEVLRLCVELSTRVLGSSEVGQNRLEFLN
ncbi:hypothetical protein Tco_0033178 [Tanacetum coccineum]